MKIIDAHSHLDYITHNFQTDVVGTVCCTLNESEWGLLTDKMKTDENIYGCFGIHPWFVQNVKVGFESRLENLLRSNSDFMVGEIGIDKYKPNIDEQVILFKNQFDIAVDLHRPVFLHCVGAWDKIFYILKQYKKSEVPMIIAHNFYGSDEIIKKLLNNYDVMFSFNKIDKDQDLHRIQQIPIENILVESDAKKEILLKDIVNKISKIKDNQKAADIIYNNTQKVLKYE